MAGLSSYQNGVLPIVAEVIGLREVVMVKKIKTWGVDIERDYREVIAIHSIEKDVFEFGQIVYDCIIYYYKSLIKLWLGISNKLI